MLDFPHRPSAGWYKRSRQPTPRIWCINRFFWPDVSATGQMLSDLAFHLAENGHEVGVITSRGLYEGGARPLAKLQSHRGVDIYRVKRPRFGRRGLAGRIYDCGSMYVRFAWALARLARRGDVVIVKTDPPLLSCAIAPVARALGLRQINWLQDLYPEVALGLGVAALNPIAPLLFAIRDWSLRSSTNVAIGEDMAARICARGVRREAVAVIPNWCDDARISPTATGENALRAEWGLAGKFVVGYSGNLGRAHECDTILAAAELLRSHGDIAFLFIGDGHLAERLKQSVRARGLQASFRFEPYQPASVLPISLSASNVHWISLRPEMEGLILPSKFYGAAAVGRATIAVADPDGELARLVLRNECGFAVRPGDGQGLASAILALRDDDDLCREMGRNARLLLDRRLNQAAAFAKWRDCLALAARDAKLGASSHTKQNLAILKASPN